MERYFVSMTTDSYRTNTPAEVEKALIRALGVIPEGVDEIGWALNKYSTKHSYTVLLNKTMSVRLCQRVPETGMQSWVMPHLWSVNTGSVTLDISLEQYRKIVRGQLRTAGANAIKSSKTKAISPANIDIEGIDQ